MMEQIKKQISAKYDLRVNEISLVREVIGTVYHIKTPEGDYAFKLYKENTNIDIDKTVAVMNHLYRHNIAIPKVISTSNNEYTIETHGRIGILMEFITGTDINPQLDKSRIIDLFHKIQDAMIQFTGELLPHGYDFYVERFLKYLSKIGFDSEKVKRLREIGHQLYESVSSLELGFIHGDFHTGNMILSQDELYILDFDACSVLNPSFDLVVVFDKTNFNRYDEKDFTKTITTLSDLTELKDIPLQALMAFIPIRHYEIIATIIDAQGSTDIESSFYDQQYEWITSFYTSWCRLFENN